MKLLYQKVFLYSVKPTAHFIFKLHILYLRLQFFKQTVVTSNIGHAKLSVCVLVQKDVLGVKSSQQVNLDMKTVNLFWRRHPAVTELEEDGEVT